MQKVASFLAITLTYRDVESRFFNLNLITSIVDGAKLFLNIQEIH